MAVGVGEPKGQHLGQEGADLARRKIDHGQHLAAFEIFQGMVLRDLGGGAFDANIVAEAVQFAQESPEPDPSELYTDVYVEASA